MELHTIRPKSRPLNKDDSFLIYFKNSQKNNHELIKKGVPSALANYAENLGITLPTLGDVKIFEITTAWKRNE